MIRRLKGNDVAGRNEGSRSSENEGVLHKKISSMEDVLEDMRSKLTENAEGHADEIRALKDEIEALK